MRERKGKVETKPKRSREKRMEASNSFYSSSPSSSASSCSDLEAGFYSCAPDAICPGRSRNDDDCSTKIPAYFGSRPAIGPSAVRFFCDGFDDDVPHHFLDLCFFCQKPLACNRDIFMYRGDTPFCSEECRQEQIEIDEAKEKSWKLSLKAAASSRSKEQQHRKAKAGSASAGSPPKSQKIHVRAGTVVAG